MGKIKPIEHGTPRGYYAENRRKIPTCEKCRKAWREYMHDMRLARGDTTKALVPLDLLVRLSDAITDEQLHSELGTYIPKRMDW